MHFRMECGTRTLIKLPPRLLCIQIERAHSLINYRMIISHLTLRPIGQFISVAGYDGNLIRATFPALCAPRHRSRLRLLFPKSRSHPVHGRPRQSRQPDPEQGLGNAPYPRRDQDFAYQKNVYQALTHSNRGLPIGSTDSPRDKFLMAGVNLVERAHRGGASRCFPRNADAIAISDSRNPNREAPGSSKYPQSGDAALGPSRARIANVLKERSFRYGGSSGS
jgi:hypothetical protein